MAVLRGCVPVGPHKVGLNKKCQSSPADWSVVAINILLTVSRSFFKNLDFSPS